MDSEGNLEAELAKRCDGRLQLLRSLLLSDSSSPLNVERGARGVPAPAACRASAADLTGISTECDCWRRRLNDSVLQATLTGPRQRANLKGRSVDGGAQVTPAGPGSVGAELLWRVSVASVYNIAKYPPLKEGTMLIGHELIQKTADMAERQRRH